VAAMNQKLKNLGHDAAKELNESIIAHNMKPSPKKKKR